MFKNRSKYLLSLVLLSMCVLNIQSLQASEGLTVHTMPILKENQKRYFVHFGRATEQREKAVTPITFDSEMLSSISFFTHGNYTWLFSIGHSDNYLYFNGEDWKTLTN